jgi:hypothetical protein
VIASAFQFLFKYQWLVFEQGRFVFGASRSMWLTSAAVAVAALYALWTYRQVAAMTGRDRVLLLGIRVALFMVVLFSLLRPMLLLKVAVPQQNFVGIILDDSSSMQVADHEGRPRGRWRAPTALLTALRFNLVFRFASPPNGSVDVGPHVQGHRNAPGRRARSRAQRVERAAGRGTDPRDRRVGQRGSHD